MLANGNSAQLAAFHANVCSGTQIFMKIFRLRVKKKFIIISVAHVFVCQTCQNI